MLKKTLMSALITGFAFSATAMAAPPTTPHETVQIEQNYAVAPVVEGKPLVVEFFWYGCGHCFRVNEILHPVLKEEKDNITLKRAPVMFPGWESGAQLYFAIQALDLEEELHDKIFRTIHVEKKDILNKKNEREKFLQEQGVDIDKFNSAYESFSVNTKLAQAKEITKTYKISSSPTFVVDNQYVFSPGINGGYVQTVDAIKQYIEQNSKKEKNND